MVDTVNSWITLCSDYTFSDEPVLRYSHISMKDISFELYAFICMPQKKIFGVHISIHRDIVSNNIYRHYSLIVIPINDLHRQTVIKVKFYKYIYTNNFDYGKYTRL